MTDSLAESGELLCDDVTGIGGEDAETVVPEAAGHEEAAVDGGDEAVGAQANFLREIVTQVTAG